MNLDFIKEATVNPIKIFDCMDLKLLRKDKCPVIFHTLERWRPFITMVADARVVKAFTKAAANKGMTDEHIGNIAASLGELQTIMSLIAAFRSTILGLYVTVIKDGYLTDDMVRFINDNRHFIDDLVIDVEGMEDELAKYTDHSEELAIWLYESISTILLNCQTYDDPEEGGVIMYSRDDGEEDQLKFDTRELEVHERYLRDLQHHVNARDKKYGKLKGGEDSMKDKRDLDVKIQKQRMKLFEYLLEMNEIKPKKYLDQDTDFIEIGKGFRKRSSLFNDSAHVDSRVFKMQFATYLAAHVGNHLDGIVKMLYHMNGDGPFVELESKYAYAKHVVENTIELMDTLIDGKVKERDLMYFNEIFMPHGGKNLRESIVENLEIVDEKITTLRANLNQGFIKSVSDADVCADLLRVAYFMSTHDFKMRCEFDIPKEFKFRKSVDTKDAIEQLGSAVIRCRKKFDCHPLFEAFINADPEIESQYPDIDTNGALSVGVIALKYLAFISGIRDFATIIDKII